MASTLWGSKNPRPYRRVMSFQDPAVQRKLQRVLIVILVIGLSLATGLLTGGFYSQLALLAVYALLLLVVGFLYISERMHLGVLLLLFCAGFVPLSLPTGTASRIPDSMVVAVGFAAIWIIRMLVVEKRFKLVYSPANKPALLWMVVVMISLAWSIYFRDPQVVIWDSFPLVQAASAILMIALPAAYLFVGNFTNRPWVLYLMAMMIILLGILAPLISPWDPNLMNVAGRLQAPSIHHFFGTDEMGRDIFSRILYGARISITVGLSIVIIAAVIGVAIGTYSSIFLASPLLVTIQKLKEKKGKR